MRCNVVIFVVIVAVNVELVGVVVVVAVMQTDVTRMIVERRQIAGTVW